MTTLDKAKAMASDGLSRLEQLTSDARSAAEDLVQSARGRSRWAQAKSFASSDAGKIVLWSLAGALAATAAVMLYRRWNEGSAYMDDFEAEAEAAGASRIPEDSGLNT